MIAPQLSVDPSGVWTRVQARKVLEIIQPEANQMGLIFRVIDVTALGDDVEWYLLQPYCLKHDIAVLPDEVCILCLRPPTAGELIERLEMMHGDRLADDEDWKALRKLFGWPMAKTLG